MSAVPLEHAKIRAFFEPYLAKLPPIPAVNEFGDQLVAFFNPDLPANQPTKSWAFSKLDNVVVIIGAYLAMVFFLPLVIKLIFGSKPAEHKEGQSVLSKLANPVVFVQALYNPAQVVLCGYMVYEGVRLAQARGFSVICNAFDPSSTQIADLLWIFYVSKVFDFLDTLFMILRRHWRQLSFLHVYHHVSIFAIYWLNMRAGYDGDIYYTIVANAFIHFVMYFYYFLRTLNIPVPTPIKMLVTNLQLIQFVTMMFQAVAILALDIGGVRSCPYPKRISVLYLVYIFGLFLLFQDFKRRTYRKGGASASSGAKGKKKKDQ